MCDLGSRASCEIGFSLMDTNVALKQTWPPNARRSPGGDAPLSDYLGPRSLALESQGLQVHVERERV